MRGVVATSFGPSALATPANAVTFARLLCAPALWLLILAAAPSYAVLAIWIVLAVPGFASRRIAVQAGVALLSLALMMVYIYLLFLRIR